MKLINHAFPVIVLLIFLSCSGHEPVRSDATEFERTMESSAPDYSSPFILGPGDEIAINVWRHDDLNRTVTIDPSGVIHLPLAGEIQTSGLTLIQLREQIAQRLSKYIVNPQVDLNLSTVRSKRVHVLGEVRSPGPFILDYRMVAWEAISRAGGFTRDANRENILLIRAQEGVAQAYAINIDVQSFLEKGKVPGNIYLQNNDVVYVLPTKIANVERFMNRVNNIVGAIVTIERSIILGKDAYDVLRGEGETKAVLAP
jgi:polysaccharide export outer membrane protein